MSETTAQDRIAMAVIDKWMRYRIDHSDLPGMQICIRKGGAILLNTAYGKANIEKDEAFTPQHLGHFASHSKMFTSCAVHFLALDGKLRLDQPMVEILTELAGAKDPRLAEVTIRDLLSNRSGIIRDGIDSDYWSLATPFPDYQRVIADTLASDLVYEPNTKTKYSNWGWSLIGLVVERVSGQSFASFVQQKILDKMPGALILPDYSEGAGRNYATGYSKQNATGKRLPLKHKPANGMMAATGFCATAETMSYFLHNLFFSDALLPRAAQRELMNLNWPVVNSKTQRYGLGVMFDHLDEFILAGHGGGYQGFSSGTRNWIGTDYIISLIFNTHESPGGVVKAVAEVIETIGKNFSEDDLKSAMVSQPMVKRWGATIYVVADKKALGFNAETWTPCLNEPVLEGQADGSYVAHKTDGFGNPGEAIRFQRSGQHNIVSVRHGSVPEYTEAEFMRLAADSLAE